MVGGVGGEAEVRKIKSRYEAYPVQFSSQLFCVML